MTYGNLIKNKIKHAFGGLFDTFSIDRKLTKKIQISSIKYFLRCFYLKFWFELGKGTDVPMEKSFLNFIYWILLKSAESYYGDSIKTEIPYTPYF